MKKLTVLNASESIARRREKMRRESLAREDRRLEDVLATPPSQQPPSQQPSVGARSSQAAVVDEEAGIITITIPATASTYSDATSMSRLVDSLLFPADEARLNQMGVVAAADWGASRAFQVLTSSLHLRKSVVAQEKRIQDVSKANIGLRQREAASRKAEQDSQQRLRDSKAEVERLRRELAERTAEVESLREQCISIVDDAIIKARGKLMLDFKEGRTFLWDPNEDILLMRELLEEGAGHPGGQDEEQAPDLSQLG
ncbi:uncharacterized protein LOC116110446 [Pistacia vera]|uniref:uncharacterized protein LOC116110446 n=1 Tax=Pistacia vera TaxID=55513 RepID=UPI001263D07C|nr:uncharacterized protein LOC116110446 [Pistacia vera]